MLIDTNIIIDIISKDAVWQDWSLNQIKEHEQQGLFINNIIYAELATAYDIADVLDYDLQMIGISLQVIPKEAAFLAAKAFVQYRKNGGIKTNVLSDFFIGAHAQVMGTPILTRDVRNYRIYFPGVPLVTPTVQ